jgi:hypothetical protein
VFLVEDGMKLIGFQKCDANHSVGDSGEIIACNALIGK